jgi:toxin ParE1/3/4
MSLPVVFRPVAQSELEEAVGWYERQKTGLGNRFRQIIEHTLARIVGNPHRFRPATQRTRRALVPRFPYAIHFAEEPEAIVILAVFHTRRDPSQLKDRK